LTDALEGVRVLELAGWMAAPGAAAIMADLGADVIKVEPLRGDAMRGAIRQPEVVDRRPIDAGFQHDNRGKRGIALAVNKREGSALVRQLAARSDVFLCNMLPRRQAKYGLDSASLFALNPRLVHATLTGYGVTGPDVERAGYDITAYFGRGGLVDSMTEPGNQAPRLRPAVGDHTAALALLSNVLAALRLVDKTGHGQVVDVSLLQTAAWTMSSDLSATLVDGVNPPRQGRRARNHALHGAFRCADDHWILLFMPEPHWWPRFCEAVGKPEWVEDERFVDFRTRRAHMSELTDLMDALFVQRTLHEWGALCDEKGFIWGPGSTIADFASDPQAEAIGLFPTIDHPDGAFRTIAAPVSIADADVRPRGPAPEIGQHTAEVLGELGIDAEQLAGLAGDGIIGGI
jgi:crotonobetainyl-CoA:carnitine CoA-transferase CaiB-like acyl-CoA transferase